MDASPWGLYGALVGVAGVVGGVAPPGLPGVEGVCGEVTVSMEERNVEYLRGVREKEVEGAGLWVASFPMPLPDDLLSDAPPLFSGLPVLEYQ